ncbi:MAG: hypothetical protein DRI87_05400 [Bacteroidetes bacterium]|nr:MAG: hypothetical protein DRI87_05400 [Bacteroidota bacterium]
MYYVQKDYPGSYYSITDERGKIVLLHDREEQVFSFDPWGRRRKPNTWDYYTHPTTYLFDRGFTGHEHLDNFDLINMNGRVYDPWLGRFLSPDNFVQSATYSQNYNRYSYALNNPLKYTDPSGEIVWVPIVIGAVIGTYMGGTLANNDYNPVNWDYSSGKTWGYMAGGAVVGGISGYFGGVIAASEIPMSNTLGIMSASYVYSVGTSIYTGGQTDISVSFGVASYNIAQGEWGYIGKHGNSTLENIGYGFGALANIQDIAAGLNGGYFTVRSRPTLAGHSQGEGKYATGYDVDGNIVYDDVLISVGPEDQSIGQGNGLKWEMEYVKRTLQGRSVQGENVAYIKPKHPSIDTRLNNVNLKWLYKMTNRLNDGRNLLNTGRLKYGLFNGCVNYTSRALLYAGVVNVNAFLPVTAPVLLNLELFLRNAGMLTSPYFLISINKTY